MLLFPVFSTIASAESVEIPPYTIVQKNTIYSNNEDTEHSPGIFTFEPNNGILEKTEAREQITQPAMSWYATRNTGYYLTTFVLGYNDESVILQKDKEYTVSLNNIYHSLLWEFQGYTRYIRAPKIESIILHATDGSMIDTSYKGITHKYGEPVVNVTFKHTPTKDIQYIEIQIKSTFRDCLNDLFDLSNGYPYYTFYYGEYNGDDKYQFSLEVTSEEVGLLNSLIEWVKGIKSKVDDTFTTITNGFSNISTNFTNLFDKISELPQKLWEKISDGLKSLFVPTENQMSQYKEDWDLLLSQRFGALYEVGTIMTEYIQSISNNGVTNNIELPEISLNGVGIPFTFGGYNVQIVPSGFEMLVNVCKKIISIVCTFLFINALRKRYDEIIRGGSK